MKIDIKQHIESTPEIMFGKSVIKGTRIPVDIILERLAHGDNVGRIISDYPRLHAADVYACLHYASLQIRGEHIYIL